MFGRRTLKQCLTELGCKLLDAENIKAVMISKNDDGDVQITLVEGKDESHKVKFGHIDHQSRQLVREDQRRKVAA